MNGGKTMIRTQMAVGDTVFALAQGQDIEALKARIESAVDRGGLPLNPARVNQIARSLGLEVHA